MRDTGKKREPRKPLEGGGDTTMFKLYQALASVGLTGQTALNVVNALNDHGLILREAPGVSDSSERG